MNDELQMYINNLSVKVDEKSSIVIISCERQIMGTLKCEFKTGDKKRAPIIVIDIDSDVDNTSKLKIKEPLVNIKTNNKNFNLVEYHHINLNYIATLDYKEVSKMSDDSIEKFLYFMVCDDLEKLHYVYGDSPLYEIIKKEFS